MAGLGVMIRTEILIGEVREMIRWGNRSAGNQICKVKDWIRQMVSWVSGQPGEHAVVQ